MVERPTDDPLPPARPVAHGSPRIGDGQGVPSERPRLPLATREAVYGCLIVLILLTAAAVGIWRRWG